MDSLFWIALGISIIGFVVLALIKRNMESKKSSTTQSIVWFIVGTAVLGGSKYDSACMDDLVQQQFRNETA